MQRSFLSRLSGFVQREGISGVSRLGATTLLRKVAGATDTWAKQVDRSGGVHRREARELLARNEKYRNKHKGQRCFVVANGSSLNTQDITLLKDEITIVMNSFWKHPILQTWQPKYYCLADPVFFDGSEPMRGYFRNLNASIGDTRFFVPLAAKPVIDELSLLPPEKTSFVAFRGKLAEGLSEVPDFRRTIPDVQSVSQLAIMTAMFLGCSPIYLLGVDHDWLAHRGQDKHFYEGIAVPGHPLTHGRLSAWTYESDLMGVLNLWHGYQHIQAVAERAGIEIVNATRGGFLDVFPRAEYESLFPENE